MSAPSASAPRVRPAEPIPTRESRVWGLSLVNLHDRRWAALGVQVIRPGGTPDPRGPRLHLLLDSDDFVLFSLAPVVKRLNWLKPRALRLRVVDASADPYVERVIADGDNRFVAIRRDYRARTLSTLRVILTGESRLAGVWSGAEGGRQGWRRVQAETGRDRIAFASVPGRILSAREHPEACLKALIEAWRNPPGALDGVYQFQPGAILHESVQMAEGVRLVGPLWIGAGVRLRRGDVVIGPRVLADQPEAGVSQRPVSWESVRYPGWRVTPGLRGRWFRVSKRTFDIAFSLAVLAATSWLYPFAIVAILIEDGWPPFFAHTRQTRRGRPFPCYKFRTMCKDAERIKQALAAENQADGPQFFIQNDPRLLKVGRVLRRLQIDELPQFWNVLLGHMSVVGPRPSPDRENQFCPAWREARLSVRPGVTGLWQVRRTRAPDTDFQEWIRYDLEYVQHESWRLDLWIIIQTIAQILRGSKPAESSGESQ